MQGRINPHFVTSILLVLVSIAAAQAPEYRTVVDVPSLTVKAKDDFPHSLSIEVSVGPKPFPYFRTEGRQQIDTATIDINAETSVSVLSKDGGENAFILYLFSEDDGGRVFGIFDLDCDGTWDVKRTPTKDVKQFILYEDCWLAVDAIDDLRRRDPTATKDGQVFEFSKSAWRKQVKSETPGQPETDRHNP